MPCRLWQDTFRYRFSFIIYMSCDFYTLISAFTPSMALFSSKTGAMTLVKKDSTCSLERPTYLAGSMDFLRSSRERLNAGSAAISSNRLLSLPSTLTVFRLPWKVHGFFREAPVCLRRLLRHPS